MKKILFTFFSIYIYSQALGQFFSVKKGDGFIKAGMSYVNTNGYFDNDGEKQMLLDYRTVALTVYGEYGFSRHINGLVRGPLFMSSSADFIFTGGETNTQSASATGDLDAGIRYSFFTGKQYELSLTALAALPSGVDNNKYGLNTGYGLLSPGIRADGRYNIKPELYIGAYAGFTKRNEGFTDDFLSGGEIGYRLLPKLWTIFHLDGIDPLENGDDLKRGGLPGLYHNNSGYLKAGLEADLVLGSFGIYAAGNYPLKGQFVQAAPDFQAGVFFMFVKNNNVD